MDMNKFASEIQKTSAIDPKQIMQAISDLGHHIKSNPEEAMATAGGAALGGVGAGVAANSMDNKSALKTTLLALLGAGAGGVAGNAAYNATAPTKKMPGMLFNKNIPDTEPQRNPPGKMFGSWGK